jgi:elongation factor Ts
VEITTAMVKELRESTGAGILDCRKALQACEGDFEEATKRLRDKGLAAVAERSDRQAAEGVLEAYVHPGSPVAVLLELNCETDFVASTDDFKDLAHDLALHIAFAAPRYKTREEAPEALIEETRDIYRAEALNEGKPEHIVDRIVEGRLEKFYEEICLMEQPFVKDEDKTIQAVIDDVRAKLGEKIILRRFVRYELGESEAEA